MTGRIRDEDIAQVRERASIDQVVGQYVQLRGAGGGSLKGLCPFHDEKSPSFHVTPSRGLYYCFGCGAGGDVIGFVQEVEHLSFTEAVERLAAQFGVQLQYTEGSSGPSSRQRSIRTRIVEANAAAAQFFAEQLGGAEAAPGRQFLSGRGFDADSAKRFGVGFAPRSWDSLAKHLRGRGFSQEELLAAGLVVEGQRGVYDRFRGRLVWTIRDVTGDPIGFGARKLFDDDEGPKYLNTPETAAYRKSEVLYGLDQSKREIAKQRQAVVVEGYTDVMAAHLAGVTTAVATCGTAFGSGHAKILRRLLLDSTGNAGAVVFTFDGDAAGRKAAMRAFEHDAEFVSQTFVAIDEHGMDPCDLRMAHGDAAVQALVERRVPLPEFVMRSVIDDFDLRHAEGRIAALKATAPLLSHIRDRSLRPEYAARLAGWLGVDVGQVVDAAKRTSARQAQAAASGRGESSAPVQPDAAPAPGASAPELPDARDRGLIVDREASKLAVQRPDLVATGFAALDDAAFRHPAYAAVRRLVAAEWTDGAGGAQWVERLRAAAGSDRLQSLVTSLAVEPLLTDSVDARYAGEQVDRLAERSLLQRITDAKAQLERTNPEDADGYNAAFTQLLELEQQRRALRDRLVGAE
jgi:DNA primase